MPESLIPDARRLTYSDMMSGAHGSSPNQSNNSARNENSLAAPNPSL